MNTEELETPADKQNPMVTFATNGKECALVFEDDTGKVTEIKCSKTAAIRFMGKMAEVIAGMEESHGPTL